MKTLPKSVINLSIIDLDFGIEQLKKNCEFFYTIELNDEVYQDVSFSNPSEQAPIPIFDTSDSIRILLKEKKTQELIGCISFTAQILIPFQGKTIQQW